MKEADLYEPIRQFFLQKGYSVQGEVKDCDMALIRGDELILIELKLRFNLELVYQAIDRQTVSDTVFVAIPRSILPKTGPRYQSMLQLVRRLDLGLIIVALDSPLQHVEILRLPSATSKTSRQTKTGIRRKKAIEKEMNNRQFTLSVGGVTGEKIPTAYREESIQVLCTLAKLEQSSPVSLYKEYGCSERSLAILSRNYYRWFLRVEHGVYGLSDKGQAFLTDGEDFREIVIHYTEHAQKVLEEKESVSKSENA